MSRTVSNLLLDLAAWIAPPHRRQWIAGLRAEAAQAGHSTGWAWGAVTTALGQRLADTVASGLALRVLLGGFVMAVAAGLAIVFMDQMTNQMPRLEAWAARTHQNLAPPLLMLAAIPLVLLSGGMAIAFSAGRPWFNRYGRLAFAMGSLAAGVSHVGALTDEGHLRHAVTAYWHQQDILWTIAGILMIAAAPALLFRRQRLFLGLATGMVGIHVAQWVLELPHLNLSYGPAPLVGLFETCAPALLILAASGLLIERRSRVTA